jgi:glycosyltransferase involved in cell wall biosynthesis
MRSDAGRRDGPVDVADQGAAKPAEPLLVSVITPSLNQGLYLVDTLRSVSQQDYPQVEHIVMDGGSTDNSVDLLRSWANAHPIRWQSQVDGGQADAIGSGIQQARGEIVTWLNSDDIYLDAHVLSDVVNAFQPGVEAVTGGGFYLSSAGARLRRIPVYPRRVTFGVLRHVDWILQPATFFRRDTLLRYPIDTTLTYAFDWDLFIRMSRDVRFKAIDRDIAGYRIHKEGKTVSGSGRRKRELLEVTGRYNSRTSPRYYLLRWLVGGYEAADRLPPPFDRMRAIFSALAQLTHVLPDGKGVQF